jgi:hypothetical protein
VVGNGMFGRNWKTNLDYEKSFDLDSMPSERSLRENLRLIESQSLSLVVNEMLQQS